MAAKFSTLNYFLKPHENTLIIRRLRRLDFLFFQLADFQWVTDEHKRAILTH